MGKPADDPIASLRQLAALACEHGTEDAARLAARLTSAIDEAIAGAPLEESLGLFPGWRTAHRMRQQEALIRELVERFGPLSSGEIAGKIKRFAGGSQAWQPGSVEELLAYLVRAGKPPSARTVRRMLEGGQCAGHSRSVGGQLSGVSLSDDKGGKPPPNRTGKSGNSMHTQASTAVEAVGREYPYTVPISFAA
jgi:hypothetical protein